MKKLILITLCGISFTKMNAQLCLSPATNFGTSAGPATVCYGDFNGDGKKDLATANASSNNVSILLGNGLGGFGSATSFTCGNGPQSVCTADFNGDGNADLAVADYFANKAAVLLGNGLGGFGPATLFTVGNGPYSVVSADLNKDGKMDLATCNYNANTISILMGNGIGGFAPAVNYNTASTQCYQIIALYITADTDVDLAVCNYSGNNISAFYNSGTGTFGPGTPFASGATPQSLCSGDFNGDLIMDIATANFSTAEVNIMIGNGSGGFAAPSPFSVGTSPNAITAADLDGDSKLDLAIGDYNDPVELWVMIGNGAGAFASPTSYAVGVHPFGVIATDLDGNGRKDVVTANYNSSNVSVLLNGPPVVGISGNLSICSGNGTSLSGTNATTYSWSSGGTNQFEFVTPGTGTTTYTLTETNGVCTSTAVATVTVTATPTITITGNLNICSGNSTILTGGTAGSYTWSPGGINSSTISVNPANSTVYTLTGENGGCMASNNATVNVTATPTVSFSGDTEVCSGVVSGYMISALSGGVAPTYSWSTGDLTQSIALNNLTSNTTYTVIETNGACSATGVITVTVIPIPVMTISGPTSLCSGNSVILTGAGANDIHGWSASAGNATTYTVSVSPTTTTTYSFSGGNLINGGSYCFGSTALTITVGQPVTPNICMVSTDSMSINNLIFWDKTVFTNMDSFIVYREVSTNTYVRIGAVSKDSLSMFVDANRLIGPANGDPNVGFYRYKLQLRDTCGNYSALSPYHSSVFFVDNHTGTFTWNTYLVEGQATPVSNFILRRDNLNNNVYVVVGIVSGNTTTLNDANYGTYQAVANWRIDATGFNCTPTMRYGNNSTQTAIIKAKSNITNNRATGMKNAENYFSVYPNPTNGNLNINFTNSVSGKVSVKVLSAIGQEVYNETFFQTNENHNIDLSKQEAGIYLVQITTNNTTTIKRIVKN